MELMVTVAIVGVVAAAAVPLARAAMRNASVNAAAFDLQLRLQGLRKRALREQRTLVAVLVDAPGNDGRGCILRTSTSRCTTLFVLRNPSAAWTLPAFDPEKPGAEAEVDDTVTLGRGIRFTADLIDKKRPSPTPFASVPVLDPSFTGSCGGRHCVAFRFGRSGEVAGEPAVAAAGTPLGAAFAIGSEVGWAGDARALLVTFPSGIVKGFAIQEAHFAPPEP